MSRLRLDFVRWLRGLTVDMARARHAGRLRGTNGGELVFEDDALVRLHAQPARGLQEDVGVLLGVMRNLAAVHARVE